MKKFVILATLFALLTGITIDSYAEAYTFSDDFHGELRDCDDNPWIYLDGTEHYVVLIEDLGNRFNILFKVQGNYEGIDLDGNEYILNYQAHVHVNFSKDEQGVLNVIVYENLVCKGSGDNNKMRIVFKITLNANGIPTVHRFLEDLYCD